MIIHNFEIAWRSIKVYQLFIKLFYSSELLQRARFIVTLICGGPYAVTIQKKPLWDCHWSSLVVIDRHWVLWTPTAGEIICHFNLWCNHSKETSLRSSLIAIDRHWVLWTPTAGEIIYHFNLWRNHSKETSLRLSLIVIGRHWSSLIVIESSELLQWEKFIVTWICVGPYGVTIQKKPLWLNVCIVQSNRV